MLVLSDDELFASIKLAISKGWIPVPNEPGYGGTGAAGRILEDEIGVSGGNLDLPDAGKWELKFHSGSALLTLFHLEARPKGHMHHMVKQFGILNQLGRLSFRHTLKGTSDMGFYVENESSLITVRNSSPSDIVWPHWTHDSLINAFVSKLRRVVVVRGQRRKGMVRFNKAMAYQEPQSTQFVRAIETGIVAIDFDARTTEGSGLRNHGTKFRISYDDLRHIYHQKKRIA